jgi:DNA-binding NtrC family response regulator
MPSLDRALIGIVDDDAVMGGTLVHRLELEGYRVAWWQTGHEAVLGLPEARPDLVVCDIRLPDFSGEEVFLQTLPRLPATPFLFVTAYGQIDQAVRLTKAGAVDYIAKPYAIAELLERLPGLIRARTGSSDALGVSEAMRELETLLRRIANIESTILFTGESGAGKEVAARFVHEISGRADAPFVAVNCAAIPGELIESEIFGHEMGSFTGAHARHLGYAERAAAGTLFLDEVGELPLAVQAKLLRLVQDRAFARVGGEVAVPCRARLVCATNADLEEAVRAGRFRRDLYYRINVIPVVVPPLRDRPEDIWPLASRFVTEFARSFGRRIHGFAQAGEQAMLAHSWPGNVRELRNRVERAVALARHEWIMAEDLFPTPAAISPSDDLPTLEQVRRNAERLHISAALRRVGGRVEDAAVFLGVSRSTLFEKIRKLGVRSPM